MQHNTTNHFCFSNKKRNVGLMRGVSILLPRWITYTYPYETGASFGFFKPCKMSLAFSSHLYRLALFWGRRHIGRRDRMGSLPFYQHAHKDYRIWPQSHGLIAIILSKTMELSTTLKISFCPEPRHKTPPLRFVIKNAMLKEKGVCYYAISQRSPLLVRSH